MIFKWVFKKFLIRFKFNETGILPDIFEHGFNFDSALFVRIKNSNQRTQVLM